MLLSVGVAEGFGNTFFFVIAGPWAGWVHVTPVVLWLGVNGGVAVDFYFLWAYL